MNWFKPCWISSPSVLRPWCTTTHSTYTLFSPPFSSRYLTRAPGKGHQHSCGVVCLHLPPDLWPLSLNPDLDLSPLLCLLLRHVTVDDHLFPAPVGDLYSPHTVGWRLQPWSIHLSTHPELYKLPSIQGKQGIESWCLVEENDLWDCLFMKVYSWLCDKILTQVQLPRLFNSIYIFIGKLSSWFHGPIHGGN